MQMKHLLILLMSLKSLHSGQIKGLKHLRLISCLSLLVKLMRKLSELKTRSFTTPSSLFTLSGNLTKEAVNAAMAQIVTGSLTSRITVVRHRCIATECDAAMFYTPNPRMPVRNDENQLMFDEDNEDGDDNEDFDVAQLFLGSAPAMQ